MDWMKLKDGVISYHDKRNLDSQVKKHFGSENYKKRNLKNNTYITK